MSRTIRKTVSVLLAAVLLCSFLGCSYLITGCAAYGYANAPEEIKEQITGTVKEEISEKLPAIGELFGTSKGTPAPAFESEKNDGDPTANEAFLALDRELFIWYVTADIVTLDQFVYDPKSFGIEESAVPVTLGDFSAEAEEIWQKDCQNRLDRLRLLNADALGDQYRYAYDNYVRYFENERALDGLFYYYEPLDEYVGIHVNLPLTFGLYEFKDEQDIKNYLALIADVPRYFGQILAFEQKRAELGLFMTEVMLDSVLEDLDSVIESRDTNFLYNTFREALDDASWIDASAKYAYYEQSDKLIGGVYTDAYVSLRDGLEALRPYCRAMVGAKAQGNKAAEYFAIKLREQSGSNLSVEETLDFLEKAAMDLYYALMAADRKAAGKKPPFSTGTVAGDERYLKTLITDIVPRMPDISVKYKEIPPELQEGFSPAAYLVPAIDHYTENTILTNPSKQTDLLTLAHEGYPGHMFQYTYQYSLGTIPLFLSVVEPIGYAEGWSTNAEYSVAKRADMFGAADLCADVLNDNLTNLIILVASIKVNGQGATQKEMEKYLAEWGMQKYSDIIYELAVNLPIYYVKYVMGFCQQYELTENCREIADFRDKDFYKEYLSWGPGYFDLLEERMLAWVKALAAR